jgi:hypothetical protein
VARRARAWPEGLARLRVCPLRAEASLLAAGVTESEVRPALAAAVSPQGGQRVWALLAAPLAASLWASLPAV